MTIILSIKKIPLMKTPNLRLFLMYHVMSPITKKSLFKGQYVLFGEYLEQSQLLYEKCCVLGYTFRDKLNAFLELLREGGDDKTLNEFIDQIGDPAAERLKS